MSGHRLQQDGGIAHRARERACLVERGSIRDDAPARAAPIGRLDADNAGEGSGLADRAAGIGSGRAETKTGGHRRCRPAGRSARNERLYSTLYAAKAEIDGPKQEVSFDEPMANSSLLSLPSSTAPSRQRLAADGGFIGRHEIFAGYASRRWCARPWSRTCP